MLVSDPKHSAQTKQYSTTRRGGNEVFGIWLQAPDTPLGTSAQFPPLETGSAEWRGKAVT